MPPFKEYRSEVGITTGRALTVTPSPIDTRGVSGAIRGVGEALLEAEKSMVRVRDFRETTEGMNFVYDKSRAIKSLSREDDGFDPTRYFAELNNTVSDAAKNITGELAREKFVFKAQRQVDAIKADIKDSFRTREINAGQASYSYQKKMVLDTVGDMSEAETLTAVDGIRHTLNEGTIAGLWNKDFEDFEIQNFEKDVAKAQADYYVLTNPEAALEELKQGEKGMFAAIPSEDRAKYIKDAERMIEANEAQIKEDTEEAMIANRITEVENIATGKRNLKESDAFIRDTATTDPEFGEAMKFATMKGPTEKEKKKYKSFIAVTKDMFKSGSPKQISDFLIKALKDSNITDAELSILTYVAQERSKEINRGETFLDKLLEWIGATGLKDVNNAIFNALEKAKGENAGNERFRELAREEVDKEVKKENLKYSLEDLEFTASETGMTTEEVLKALRIKEGR